jgi:hypothetical protein
MDAQALRQDASRAAQDLVLKGAVFERAEVFDEVEVVRKTGLWRSRTVRSTVREVESVIDGWRLWRQITGDEVKSGGYVRQTHIELWLTIDGNLEVVTTEEVTWAGGNGQRDQAVARRPASDDDLRLPGARWEAQNMPLFDIFYERSQWRPVDDSGSVAPLAHALEQLLQGEAPGS